MVLQTQTEIDELGHVFSVQTVLTTGAFGIATFLFGWLAEYQGIEVTFYLSALISIGAGIFTLMKRKSLTYELVE